MKMFILVPPQHRAYKGSFPLVACDNEDWAETHKFVEYWGAYSSTQADDFAIMNLEVDESHTDASGWKWTRVFDTNLND